MTITSPHAAAAAVVNIATGAVTLVESLQRPAYSPHPRRPFAGVPPLAAAVPSTSCASASPPRPAEAERPPRSHYQAESPPPPAQRVQPLLLPMAVQPWLEAFGSNVLSPQEQHAAATYVQARRLGIELGVGVRAFAPAVMHPILVSASASLHTPPLYLRALCS